MSSIDNRIVKMTFDNSQFEKNANTSLSTIEKLKTSLNFSGATKGLENIGASVKQVDMSPIESGVQKIADKFDAMGVVAFTALQNITNSAMEMVSRSVSFPIPPRASSASNMTVLASRSWPLLSDTETPSCWKAAAWLPRSPS